VIHFRKRIEPRILSTLAFQLLRLGDQYTRTFVTPPPLSKTEKRPETVPPDIFAWETLEHQEFICRLWSGVYGLRAALLNAQRLLSMEGAVDKVRASVVESLWHAATLMHLHSAYCSSYAGTLLPNPFDLEPRDVVRLAGWSPTTSAEEFADLSGYVVEGEGVREFASRLDASTRGARVLRRWMNEMGAQEGCT
jgi:hypothetical protein